ncbi:MAG: hypothetical protein HQM12_23900 [SAR324 cluster bacterium]|nr:hypothetical protein [SAR324 cluster bacterium]
MDFDETILQLELPLVELKKLDKYSHDRELNEVYSISRTLDGSLTKDFICAIPKDFPETGVYTRERIYMAKDGSRFVKRYTLKGVFRESDEDERIFLTAYWRLIGNHQMEFSFSLVDYLRFKNVNASTGTNRSKFIDFLKRTRSNTWQLNYWFDYHSKQFREDTEYGIIQKFKISRLKSERGKDKIIITVAWSKDYFDALERIENWKYFALNVYSQIPHTNGILKKIIYFLGNGNNEFAVEFEDHMLVKVDLKILCEFFLAMPERTGYWEHKKNLKKPLEQLKDFSLVRFDQVEDCFFKENKKVYLILHYYPPSPKHRIESTFSSPLLTPNTGETLNELPSHPLARQLETLGISKQKIREWFDQYSEERLQEVMRIALQYKTPLKDPEKFMGKALKEGWLATRENSRKQQLDVAEQEPLLQMDPQEKWNYVKRKFLSGRAHYGLLTSEQKKLARENIETLLNSVNSLEEIKKQEKNIVLICLDIIEQKI